MTEPVRRARAQAKPKLVPTTKPRPTKPRPTKPVAAYFPPPMNVPPPVPSYYPPPSPLPMMMVPGSKQKAGSSTFVSLLVILFIAILFFWYFFFLSAESETPRAPTYRTYPTGTTGASETPVRGPIIIPEEDKRRATEENMQKIQAKIEKATLAPISFNPPSLDGQNDLSNNLSNNLISVIGNVVNPAGSTSGGDTITPNWNIFSSKPNVVYYTPLTEKAEPQKPKNEQKSGIVAIGKPIVDVKRKESSSSSWLALSKSLGFTESVVTKSVDVTLDTGDRYSVTEETVVRKFSVEQLGYSIAQVGSVACAAVGGAKLAVVGGAGLAGVGGAGLVGVLTGPAGVFAVALATAACMVSAVYTGAKKEEASKKVLEEIKRDESTKVEFDF